jgi:hypothetical protein
MTNQGNRYAISLYEPVLFETLSRIVNKFQLLHCQQHKSELFVQLSMGEIGVNTFMIAIIIIPFVLRAPLLPWPTRRGVYVQ